MTRAAHGVLIAVPETAWAKGGAAIREAVTAASELRGFLEQRFPGARIELVAPEPGRPVTKAAVLDAFAAAHPAPGDLFVVLFFGHGLPADSAHPYQSWALTTEELTDVDLAGLLRQLPPDVDTVVISTCCYGRGFYYVGPRSPETGAWTRPLRMPSLRQLSRAFAMGVQDVVDAPMVCISAAGSGEAGDGIVLRAVAGQLLAEIQAAAEEGISYRDLDERFRRRRAAGHEFHVDARPADRLDQAVLATEVLPCARDGRAAGGAGR
ncbi:MAG TPA: hypothetical protein VN253_08870 [Kofleriaceae bacterium]|nr:hypothetical protein [Kofleriaceae bacterium]